MESDLGEPPGCIFMIRRDLGDDLVAFVKSSIFFDVRARLYL
jgi:hypothetical protein